MQVPVPVLQGPEQVYPVILDMNPAQVIRFIVRRLTAILSNFRVCHFYWLQVTGPLISLTIMRMVLRFILSVRIAITVNILGLRIQLNPQKRFVYPALRLILLCQVFIRMMRVINMSPFMDAFIRQRVLLFVPMVQILVPQTGNL